MSEEPWKLYYWPPEVLQGGPGRAEFVRLIFEEARVPYKEVNENIFQLFKGGQWQGYPAFAVPLIQKGNLIWYIIILISVNIYIYICTYIIFIFNHGININI